MPSSPSHLFQRPATGLELSFYGKKEKEKVQKTAQNTRVPHSLPHQSALLFSCFSISAIISNFYSFAYPSWSIWLELETRMKAPSKHFWKYIISFKCKHLLDLKVEPRASCTSQQHLSHTRYFMFVCLRHNAYNIKYWKVLK